MNSITQRIYIILYKMLYFENPQNSAKSMYTSFKRRLKICAFKERYFFKNLYNFLHSKYTNFQRIYKILHVERTQLLED